MSNSSHSAADFCRLQGLITPLTLLVSHRVQTRKHSCMHSTISYEQLPDQ